MSRHNSFKTVKSWQKYCPLARRPPAVSYQFIVDRLEIHSVLLRIFKLICIEYDESESSGHRKRVFGGVDDAKRRSVDQHREHFRRTAPYRDVDNARTSDDQLNQGRFRPWGNSKILGYARHRNVIVTACIQAFWFVGKRHYCES